MRKPTLGSLRRRATSLSITLTFGVLATTGVLAFVRPFSIEIVGLHSLMGFLFIAIVGLHLLNNIRPLKGYLHGRVLWVVLAVTGALTTLFLLQPAAVTAVLGLSRNLGPALDRFEVVDDRMIYRYAPAEHYRMKVTVKGGQSFDPDAPPAFAIWLENQGAYHIKTLHGSDNAGDVLPYWNFKRRGWEEARLEAEGTDKVDLVSSPTPNGSFDPADYILPADPETTQPYRLLIEINQPGDPSDSHADQPSLVYAVEIDELDPRTFQTLHLVGYPKREDKEDGGEAWSLYFVDEAFGSALELIDSALLEIERTEP